MAVKKSFRKIRKKLKKILKSRAVVTMAIIAGVTLAFYVPQQVHSMEQQVGDSTTGTNVSTVYQYYLLKDIGNHEDDTPWWDIVKKAKKAGIGALSGGNVTNINYSDMIQAASDENEAKTFVTAMVTLNGYNYLDTTSHGLEAIGGNIVRTVFGFILSWFGLILDILVGIFSGLVSIMAKMNVIVLIGNFFVDTGKASPMLDALGLTKDEFKKWLDFFLTIAATGIVILVVYMMRKGTVDQQASSKLKGRLVCLIGMPVIMAGGATIISDVMDISSNAFDVTPFEDYLLDTESWAKKSNFSLEQIGATSYDTDSYLDTSYNPYIANGMRATIAKGLAVNSEYNKGFFKNTTLALGYMSGSTYDAMNYLSYECSNQSSTDKAKGSIVDFMKTFKTSSLTDFSHSYSSRGTRMEDWDGLDDGTPVANVKDDYVDDKKKLIVPKSRLWCDRYIYGAKAQGDMDTYYKAKPSMEQAFAGAGGNHGQNFQFSDASMFYILSTKFDEDGGTFFLSSKPTTGIASTISNFDSQRTSYYSVSMVGNPIITTLILMTKPLVVLTVFIATFVAFLNVGIIDMNLKPFRAWIKGCTLGDINYGIASLYYVLGIVATIIAFTLVPLVIVDFLNKVMSLVAELLSSNQGDGTTAFVSEIGIGIPVAAQSLAAMALFHCYRKNVLKCRDKLTELLMMPWIWASDKGQRLEDSAGSMAGISDKAEKKHMAHRNAINGALERTAVGNTRIQRGLNKADEMLENATGLKGAGGFYADQLQGASRSLLKARAGARSYQPVESDSVHSAEENAMNRVKTLGSAERIRETLSSLANPENDWYEKLKNGIVDSVGNTDADKAFERDYEDMEHGLEAQSREFDDEFANDLDDYSDTLDNAEFDGTDENAEQMLSDLDGEQEDLDERQIASALNDEGEFDGDLPADEMTEQALKRSNRLVDKSIDSLYGDENDEQRKDRKKSLRGSYEDIAKLKPKELTNDDRKILDRAERKVARLKSEHGLTDSDARRIRGFHAVAKRAVLAGMDADSRQKYLKADSSNRALAEKSGLTNAEFEKLKSDKSVIDMLDEKKKANGGQLSAEDQAIRDDAVADMNRIAGRSSLKKADMAQLADNQHEINNAVLGTLDQKDKKAYVTAQTRFNALADKSGLDMKEISDYRKNAETVARLEDKTDRTPEEQVALNKARARLRELDSKSSLDEQGLKEMSGHAKTMEKLKLAGMSEHDRSVYMHANGQLDSLRNAKGMDSSDEKELANAQTTISELKGRELTDEQKARLDRAQQNVAQFKADAQSRLDGNGKRIISDKEMATFDREQEKLAKNSILKQNKAKKNIESEMLGRRQRGIDDRREAVAERDVQKFRRQVQSERETVASVQNRRSELADKKAELERVHADWENDKTRRKANADAVATAQINGISQLSKSVLSTALSYEKNPTGSQAFTLQRQINKFNKTLDKVNGVNTKGIANRLNKEVGSIIKNTPVTELNRSGDFTMNGQSLDGAGNGQAQFDLNEFMNQRMGSGVDIPKGNLDPDRKLQQRLDELKK